MRALVVYESLWGNTERVARALAIQLGERMSVELFEAASAPADATGFDLVVVGGPTHAFSMTRPSTRADASKGHAGPHAVGSGIREWIAALPRPSAATRAATFDTRVDSPRLPGSAAKAARHELRSLGFDVRDGAKSFRVHGYEGPLVDGELERAAEWASGLGVAGVGVLAE